MNSVSPDQQEITRKTGAKIQGAILQRLAEVTQSHAATCMGVDASTVSRIKEDLTRVCQLLAAIDLQVAPTDAMVLSQARIEALELFSYEYLRAKIESRTRHE